MTRLLPGPYATEIFADFGAEVIKIEQPEIGDYSRDYGAKVDGKGVMFDSLNKGKKSLCLNIHNRKEREQLLKLIETADVLIESFRPGLMKRIGLDYDNIKKINPSIIYCSITGFGQKGTLSMKAGHDLTYLSYTGMLDLMTKGRENVSSENMIPPLPITDIGASLNTVTAVLLAYINRLKNGEGQYIDMAIVDGIYSNCMQLLLPQYMATKEVPNIESDALFGAYANYCVYKTKDNRHISVAAIEPKFWQVFCKGIGREDFFDYLSDKKKMRMIKAEIQDIIKERTMEEWVKLLEKQDACVAPVVRIEEIQNSIPVRERKLLNPDTGAICNHFHFSTIRTKEKGKSPELGQHNKEYLDYNAR